MATQTKKSAKAKKADKNIKTKTETQEIPKGYEKVETKFGDLHYSPEHVITFPQGLYGFFDQNTFVVTKLPQMENSNFLLLQSLTKADVAFFVLPINPETSLIELEDLKDVCATLEVNLEDCSFLLIASVKTEEDGLDVTVNLKAPLIIDHSSNVACQYVFPGDKYDMYYPIPMMEREEKAK